MDVAGRRTADIGGQLDFTGRFEMTIWYAPDVKRFVKMEHRIWSQNRMDPKLLAHDVIELLAYRPGS